MDKNIQALNIINNSVKPLLETLEEVQKAIRVKHNEINHLKTRISKLQKAVDDIQELPALEKKEYALGKEFIEIIEQSLDFF